MRKKVTRRNLTLMEFVEKYKLPDNFGVDSIPLKHPETGEKIYLIGEARMEEWYRKMPGQGNRDGQMWPLMQGPGFDIRELEVHPDIRRELAGVGTFTKKSSIKQQCCESKC